MAINLNQLKKSITVATVLTIVACLVPESAQAIILKFSGSPNNNQTFVDFTINTSIKDSKPDDPNVGLFKEAVQEATFTCSQSNNSTFGCTEAGEIFSFSAGNLTASQISDDTVQYEALLFDSNFNYLRLGIRVNSTDSEFINSLSPLGEVLIETGGIQVAALLNSPNPLDAGLGFQVTEVPEPDTIGCLLSAGILGVALLPKGSRRSRKLNSKPN